MRERDPDMFLAVSSIGINGLAVALAGRIWRRPAVVRLTSDVFQVWRSEKGAVRKLRMYARNNLLGRLAMTLATRTVALHERQVAELAALGYRPERFYVVPQPITFPELADRAAARRRVRAELGIPQEAYVVGYIGRLDPGKAPHMLADVLARLLGADPALHVAVVGDGASRPIVEDALAGQSRAHFTGQLPRDTLTAYYAALDVLVHTSFGEGLSNVIVEALSLGVPVVATDSGAITRALVSTIARDGADMAAIVLERRYRLDPVPDNMRPDINARLWQELVTSSIRARAS
jgi:glycosyltransferase involved in cell wall biosynthesis